MPEPTRPGAPAVDQDEPTYGRADSILFQTWLVLFLMVVCFALANYLLSYIPFRS